MAENGGDLHRNGLLANDLLTIEEMAKVLRVPRFWILSRTRQGQKAIPHLRMGRHIRFNKQQVLDFFAKKEK